MAYIPKQIRRQVVLCLHVKKELSLLLFSFLNGSIAEYLSLPIIGEIDPDTPVREIENMGLESH